MFMVSNNIKTTKRAMTAYSRYWTGTSLQLRLIRGNNLQTRLMSFTFEKASHISLNCMLVLVQHRQHEDGQLKTINIIFVWSVLVLKVKSKLAK